MNRIAGALFGMRSPSKLILLDGLMDTVIDGLTIQTLFAYVRTRLVERTGDHAVAIHAPLGATGERERDFPLHADLYPSVFLLNVFDRVPAGDSGASLFLPMRTLREFVQSSDAIPPATKRRFQSFWTSPAQTDRYEEFYDLLHGRHPWGAELGRAMRGAAMRIRLERGQGYLLHDRKWLHGREEPAGGVPSDRLHRLTFDTAITRRRRMKRSTPPEHI
jgi:hypothetical protein